MAPRRNAPGEADVAFTEEEAVAEARRCLACKKPGCVPTCPIHQDVPGYVGAIAREDYREALRIIMRDNPFPGSCGRVCPHPCQGRCVLGKKEEPTSIARLKRFAADAVDARSLGILPGEDTGKEVGIVGSGPAGLSAAYHLALMGHKVVVYESFPVAGGMLAVGIPEYRLPRSVVEAEVDFIRGLGVDIRTGVKVTSLDDLDHDAIFIGVGAHLPVRLNIEGAGLFGVDYGTPFLEGVNLGKRPVLGRRGAVIGGGNVAVDAARTAKRLGAREVMVIYRRSEKEMPAYREEVEAAEEEGIEFHFLTAPVRILGQDGHVKALECIRMELGECDESGRCRPVPLEGSEFTIPVDNVIPAISQYPEVSWLAGKEIEITGRKTIGVDRETGRTAKEGVFAGGDCATGPATVAHAIAAGKRAALGINEYLSKGD